MSLWYLSQWCDQKLRQGFEICECVTQSSIRDIVVVEDLRNMRNVRVYIKLPKNKRIMSELYEHRPRIDDCIRTLSKKLDARILAE